MMDPELIKLAQEQMSKISQSELAKIQQQMMSNPELVRMAAEGMKNMRPEDLKTAAEQLKYVRPEDMVEIGEKMANATPEEIAAMRARADAQITYELNAARMLKKQGRFSDAAQKYLLAKKNLQGVPVANSGMLQLTCSLNLMSCYLKTRQYDECIKEGSEVLTYDSENVKALYRRGQAFKELGMLENAVSDLSKAHAVSPDDETIAGVLRDAKERMEKEGLVIEEIDEEGQTIPVESHKNSVTQPQEASECLQSASKTGGLNPDAACFHGLNNDPEALRSFQNFIANADPNTLAALSAGKSDVPPDMVKTASNMISKMTPEELQKMIQMASSFKGKSSFFNGGSVETNGDSSTPGSVPPVISPEMLQTATDMMNKMSMEDLHKMFKMASLKEKDPFSTETMVNTNGPRSDTGSRLTEAGGTSTVNQDSFAGGSSLNGLLSNSISHASPPPSLPTSTADLQDKMRDQMKDPAMRQMFTSMIKNMSPDMMANMSEQFGVKLSREDAEKAQQAMSSLSPDDLEKMMRWADRIQTGVESAKKTKNWLLGRPGMILALCMLILAIILHWLGFIGK